MKTEIPRKAKPQQGFEDEYRSSLLEYAARGDEPTLRLGYELGRRALAEQRSLVEMASLHHRALVDLVRDAENEERREKLLRSSAEFLAECLSPYEMAQRGFQDAVKALRGLNETLEEEIKRIAYAVHDEAGQLLVAVHLALAEAALGAPEPQEAQFARIKELLNEVEKQLRRYSHELRPTILDDLGWIPAIRFLADGVSKRAGVAIYIDAPASERLPRNIETVLYRVVQEALNNAVKHAKAGNIWISATKEKLALRCSIRDDGDGFDPHQARSGQGRKGLGLIGMQERVSAIGGTLRIDSCAGKGTELSIGIPMEDDHASSHRARG